MKLFNVEKEQNRLRNLELPVSAIVIESSTFLKLDLSSKGGKYLTVKMERQAWKDLLEISGLNMKMVSYLNDMINNKVGFRIMRLITEKISSGTLNLVFNQNKLVSRIHAGGVNQVSFEAVGNIITDLTEQNPDAEIANVFIQNDATLVEVQLRNNGTEHSFGIRNENVILGHTIKWDMFGTVSAAPYAERLVCTNGMIGLADGEYINLGTDYSNWAKLYEPRNNDRILNSYLNSMNKARSVNLSVNEYQQIRGHLNAHYHDTPTRIEKYMGDGRWEMDYVSRGIDVTQLTKKQLSNCPTPVNAWDAFNALTDFGSHKYGKSTDGERVETQRLAGKFLNRSWDANQQIHNIPIYGVKNPK